MRSLKAPYGMVEKLFPCRDRTLRRFNAAKLESDIHSKWL